MRWFHFFGALCLLSLLVSCGSSPRVLSFNDASLDTRLRQHNLKIGSPVFIRAFKEERLLELWMKNNYGSYVHFTDYPICNYSGLLGPKIYEGDRQTPEGFYKIFLSSLNPRSQYHKSFNIGYPNLFDQAHGRTGNYIMVHGECVSAGCYAMRNDQIDEIYILVQAALRNGQGYIDFHAFPFKMTKSRMKRAKNSEHYVFWRDLERGYHAFERTGRVPEMRVTQGRYLLE